MKIMPRAVLIAAIIVAVMAYGYLYIRSFAEEMTGDVNCRECHSVALLKPHQDLLPAKCSACHSGHYDTKKQLWERLKQTCTQCHELRIKAPHELVEVTG